MSPLLRKIDPRRLQLDGWATALESQLTGETLEIYCRRRDAIIELVVNKNSGRACEISGLSRFELRRVLLRCIELDDEGEPMGFRACVPFSRVKSYARVALDGGGVAGLLGALFRAYPAIERQMEDFAMRRGKRLALPARVGRTDLRDKFLELCRAAGIQGGYPFNTFEHGIRSLAKWRDKLVDKYARESVRADFGFEAGRNVDLGYEAAISGVDPFTVYVADEYTIDSPVCLPVKMLNGKIEWVPISRFKIISFKRRGARDIIASVLVLKTEPNTLDFLSALEAAIRPHKRIEFTIPGYEYPPGPCFASDIPGCEWLVPDVVMLDNSKVHRSDDVRRALIEGLGATAQFGLVRHPKARGDIENWHSLLASQFRGLASTTATGPKDARRYKAEETAIEMRLQIEHVHEMLELCMARYNTMPLDSLKSLTPIEALREWANGHVIPRRVPEREQAVFQLAKHHANVTIYTDAKNGRFPSVKYQGAEYRSSRLAGMRSRKGEPCVLVLGEADASVGVLYEANGLKIDDVYAVGIWSEPHRLSERKYFRRLRRRRILDHPGYGQSPVAMLRTYLASNAATDKRSGLALANLERRTKAKAAVKPPAPRKEPVSSMQGTTIRLGSTNVAVSVGPIALPATWQ